MNRLLLPFIFLLCILLFEIVWSPGWDLMQAQPRFEVGGFENYSVEDGLPHRRVFDIEQDEYGFLWLATQNGLSRFDGHSFKNYVNDPEDPTSLSGNYIRELEFDSEGKLWIEVYGGGLNRFDPETEVFERFRHQPDDPGSLPPANFRALARDGDRGIWVLGSRQVSRFDLSSRTFQTIETDPLFKDPANKLSATVNQGYSVDTAGNLYLVSGRGFLKLDRSSGNPEKLQEIVALQHLEHRKTSAFLRDSQGIFWVVADRQLYRVDPRDPEPSSGTIPLGETIPFGDKGDQAEWPEIFNLFEDSSGQIWLSTIGAGACRVNGTGEGICYRQDALNPAVFPAIWF